MNTPRFQRSTLRFLPLKDRENLVLIDKAAIRPEDTPAPLPPPVRDAVESSIAAISLAREKDRPVMLSFGAHAIKNGLSPILIRLIEDGWITHLATNGAGIIHDWEFAYQGASSEDVRTNLSEGAFGAWEETGFILNMALCIGAYEGYGYGESIGALVHRGGIDIPHRDILVKIAKAYLVAEPSRSAAALDLLGKINELDIRTGHLQIAHPYAAYGLQAAAFRLGVPYTAHPMFGHDIIYMHPANCGAAVGRTAEVDFLKFAGGVGELQGGVYLSIGSAVMSPMVFEKSLSMARNAAKRNGTTIDDFSIFVVDIDPADWDWATRGEPPSNHPAYYKRYMKTFHRTGAQVEYVCSDNRSYLAALYHGLKQLEE